MNEKLFLAVNSGWARPWMDPIMRAATLWGNPAVLLLATAVLLYLWDKPRFKRNATTLVAAWLLAIVASEALKFVFNTPRPLTALGVARVRVLGKPEYLRGFPSGHATRTFAVAAAFLKDYPPLGILLLLAAAATGVSRLYVGAHFPSDVLGGLILGLACGFAARKFAAK